MKKILCLGLLLCIGANALEVVFVDVEKVFTQYHKTKTADAAINKQKEIHDNYVKRERENVEKMMKSAVSLREETQNIALSNEDREGKYKELEQLGYSVEAKKKELVAFMQQKERDILKQLDTTRENLLKEIEEYLENYGKREKVDLVMDISNRGVSGSKTFPFYNKSKEITDKILKNLNLGHEEELKKLETAKIAKKEEKK